MKDLEMRTLGNQPCELRMSGEGEAARPQITGYAAVFNSRSALLFGSFMEEIAPGAFDDVLDDDVRALFNHDPNFVLGRTRSNTLGLEIDSRGLAYTINPPDTQTVRDLVLTPLKRGDLTGSSFAFRVAVDGDEWRREGEIVVRTIHKLAELRDVSPVTYPAYGDSHAAQRSLDSWRKNAEGMKELVTKAVNERRARERFLELMSI
ncbi:HK97 family phage prohead protease [Bordetella avium]|uniref:Phage capsid protease n=1 Tax=Bordetella avium (strain 197N) TaxID=360910 RepID=Q2L2B1_BORA1|nr:HK97 family phage prohead protease [Bordetella avium]AZY48851.1 HK97 family phage prohead protease [Bordetella avium]AZY52231.1 HK97 family phage prohead protease [Bordetella avium]RIQ47790.1 HK97 family phage prohead protease [Bordetella avium]RIQ71040.1 HK97 family phage prohead protease [Bordetella avium]CAJ49075.1 Putative phage capsid protease [Bordetella avium 197N]